MGVLEEQPVAASTSWIRAAVNTEAVPPDATALSFGVSLYSAGTLDVDDLSLGDLTLANESDPPPCGSECATPLRPPRRRAPQPTAPRAPSRSPIPRLKPWRLGPSSRGPLRQGPGRFGYTLAASNPGSATSGYSPMRGSRETAPTASTRWPQIRGQYPDGAVSPKPRPGRQHPPARQPARRRSTKSPR